jgi:hypothetical protein
MTIYHGTPMTPRAALLDVCAGRAMCVSFYRPDDVEAVEAVSPAIMFRQWRVFLLESGAAGGAGVGNRSRLVGLLRMAGASPVSPRTLGSHSRHAGRTVSTQRCAVERMAARPAWRSSVAYGRAYRAAAQTVRKARPGMSRLGWPRQGDRLPRLSRADGGGRQGLGQPLAGSAHDARDGGGLRLPLRQRGQHFTCTERMAL